ncbi:LuxR C-terminal-related transcriptional regulator [Edaphobacter albus]|uniref:LuxR C-terminal-related transcriptional regulator n=1 Tax=Edaphobacter sp. 4G125 TaxID=2763071 RepID=UPI0016481C66|nr:response regulator transcription factor [Edaphobacter sp. 4G125]QNI37722.1 response regulator transcription factor [Edaphobacter sp. 4G125]
MNPTGAIRIYLLDDHTLFREGLRRLLGSDCRFIIAGQSGDPAQALADLQTTPVDVLVLDYDLGKDNALDMLGPLQSMNFAGKILVVTAGFPDKNALALIKGGISGIFHKQESPENLQRAILEVAQGRVLIDQQYLQAVVAAAQPQETIRFTERERITLRYLLQGLANKQIAANLDISESAVKATLQQLFSKTGVRTRSQLVLLAIEKYRDQL